MRRFFAKKMSEVETFATPHAQLAFISFMVTPGHAGAGTFETLGKKK
jgi:hypothetical protein